MNLLHADESSAVPSPMVQLPKLPYGMEELEPFVTAITMGFHYGKHHQGYVDNLNKLIVGTPYAGATLEEILRKTVNTVDTVVIFNNAAQVWNHTFYWHSMKAKGGGQPTGRLLDMILEAFGTFEAFKNAFVTAGISQFGSGWVWLIQDNETVKIIKSSNADTPEAHGRNALLACDVWEHAYYLDYQNRRKDYLTAFLDNLANWEFATSRLNLCLVP